MLNILIKLGITALSLILILVIIALILIIYVVIKTIFEGYY